MRAGGLPGFVGCCCPLPEVWMFCGSEPCGGFCRVILGCLGPCALFTAYAGVAGLWRAWLFAASGSLGLLPFGRGGSGWASLFLLLRWACRCYWDVCPLFLQRSWGAADSPGLLGPLCLELLCGGHHCAFSPSLPSTIHDKHTMHSHLCLLTHTHTEINKARSCACSCFQFSFSAVCFFFCFYCVFCYRCSSW